VIVISSTTREEPADTDDAGSGEYGWIWRSIRYLTVGLPWQGRAACETWMLHWGAAGVRVSRAGGFLCKFDACCLQGSVAGRQWEGMHQAPTRNVRTPRLARWGVLPEFLRELAMSDGGEERRLLTLSVELLARADWLRRCNIRRQRARNPLSSSAPAHAVGVLQV